MKIHIFNFGRFYKSATYLLKPLIILLLVVSSAFTASKFYLGSEDYLETVNMLNDRKTVIIDAGHGGEDCGTIGVDGSYEKDLNLEFAMCIGELLSKEGYAVIYTRTDDKLLYTDEENIYGIRKISDLKNRCKIAAEYENSLFISIHMNSYSNPKYKGLQVYYGIKNSESYKLASIVQNTVKNDLQKDSRRKIKAGNDIYILENTTNPAILIECGFLSNPEECKSLSEKEYQKSLCFSIVCGIINYNKSQSDS